VTLAGCPLEREDFGDESSQERRGFSDLGGRARHGRGRQFRWVAATGHRICNDCMKACIYQKQEPVDIPQIETRTLKDVLGLPWGFEIYSLLTRLESAQPPPADPAFRRRAAPCWWWGWARPASISSPIT